jgi:omega-6 fatty acid desaturase (delta-12 desaturase)
MFGIGPIWSLLVGPRIWAGAKSTTLRNSILLTNLAVATMLAGAMVLFGWQEVLLIEVPIILIAGTAGVWLFFVQHQFEDVYWENGDSWNYTEAALQGSSYLKLAQPFQFFTGNIGLHHVHHLSARVPNYNLQRAHDEVEVFHQVPVLTFRGSLRCSRLKLWDEHSKGLVTFAQGKASMRAASPAGNPATATSV